MNLLRIGLITLGLFYSSLGFGQSFSSGNKFTQMLVTGQVQVQCNGGQMAFFNCEDSYLSPGDADYFQGPNIDADEVDLSATHENGKVINKHSNYANGKSTSRFNLSINTLFQRALLDMGKNEIQFVLKKKGTMMTKGSFVVTVDQGPTATCRSGYLNSFNNSLCTDGNMACQQYFSEYCQ